jgi:hypothetical protein
MTSLAVTSLSLRSDDESVRIPKDKAALRDAEWLAGMPIPTIRPIHHDRVDARGAGCENAKILDATQAQIGLYAPEPMGPSVGSTRHEGEHRSAR